MFIFTNGENKKQCHLPSNNNEKTLNNNNKKNSQLNKNYRSIYG